MTTSSNLSGDEISKRLGSAKLSKKQRRKIMKDAILSFEKEKEKKGKKHKKITAKDILRRTGQMKEAVIDPGSYSLANSLMKKYPKIRNASKLVKKAIEDEENEHRKKRIQNQKEEIIEVIRFEKKSS